MMRLDEILAYAIAANQPEKKPSRDPAPWDLIVIGALVSVILLWLGIAMM
jgi:hypothetical protein